MAAASTLSIALNLLMQMAIPPAPLVYQRGGTQLVTGGRVMEQTDLVAYRDMVTIIRDRVRDQIRRGVALPQDTWHRSRHKVTCGAMDR